MSSPSNPLSDREGEVLLATVAGLALAQMPLAAGLRAASRESRGRLSQALRAIADQVARGQTIEQICGEEGSALPSHLRGLVSAAARTGQLGTALEEVVGHQRAARLLRSRLFGSLAYPVLVLMLNGVVVAFLFGWVVPVFKQMFLEFRCV